MVSERRTPDRRVSNEFDRRRDATDYIDRKISELDNSESVVINEVVKIVELKTESLKFDPLYAEAFKEFVGSIIMDID